MEVIRIGRPDAAQLKQSENARLLMVFLAETILDSVKPEERKSILEALCNFTNCAITYYGNHAGSELEAIQATQTIVSVTAREGWEEANKGG